MSDQPQIDPQWGLEPEKAFAYAEKVGRQIAEKYGATCPTAWYPGALGSLEINYRILWNRYEVLLLASAK